MECFLTNLGTTLTEKVLNKAIEKSRNIFCFTCIVKEFNEEKDKLEAGKETMREKFQVATNKGKGIKYDARFWEEQANKLIQENTEPNKRCFLGFCPDFIWRYKRGEDLLTKTKEIRKLMEEKFENVELDRHLPGVERYSSQYYISFESRKLKYEELLDALRDDNNYITGLQGMGGTGKTTLAKEVGKQLKTPEQFKHVIDTKVSFTPDIKKIQDDIAGPLGLEFKGISESDRSKELWSRLTNGEKILLILDDVWGNLNFDDIGIPKSDNHKGCKVLVTTRNLRVCNQMVCENKIQLDLLNEEEAWSMFKLHANLTDNSSQSILEKGRKIATECKRLPVAIATVASSLKGQKRREEWDISLKTLQKLVSVGDVGDDLVDIYKCLKFSYDFLKDKKAEGLFLLCSTFPENAEISTEVLTRLGIGVGLFGDDYGSYEDARTQATASKNKLLDSCLLLEAEEGYVKMHDLVREVAQLIGKNEIKIVNFSNKSQKSLVESDKKIKYLICEGNLRDLFANKFDVSELEILIGDMHMKGFLQIPISFFKNIPRLRVLNLSGHSSYPHPLSLPQSMELLSNIRSLSFAQVDLSDISVFGGLQSLETLELTHCAIDELPHEIEKLKNFRLLTLEKCYIRNNNPFEVIQRCTSLEELYFLNSFNDSCKEITLPTLQRYCLSDNTDYAYKMKDTISRGVSLTWDYFSEATFKYLMETTELLHLEGIDKGWRNLMPGIVSIDNGMNDLIKLYLRNCHQVQCLVDTKHINSQVPSVFSNLKTVTLDSCSMLVSIFDMSTSRGLLLLETLKIFHCKKLENIITTDCDNDNNNSCNSMFPNLKFLCIYDSPKLQFVLPCYSAGDFLLLEYIGIQKCAELKYIFGQHQDAQLASLKQLELDDVPNFIDIFPEPSSIKGSSNSISKPQTKLEPVKSNTFSWSQICCYGNKSRGSTSTKMSLVSKDQPKDCSITLESSSYFHNLWERAQCLSKSHIMCNIKKMTLYRLPKIKSVFVMSVASKLSLESLDIVNCDELEHIIVDIEDGSGGNNWGNNVFPKLKELLVFSCEKLEYIFGHIDATDHHQNHNNEVTHLHLPALKYLKLHRLQSLIGMCTKHYCTTLPPLTLVELVACSKVDITSIGDFIGPNYSNKELSANVENLCPKVENIRFLKNLKVIKILGCEKLEIVFSTSMIMCLPQLLHIRIEECKELKHMIEDDLENKNSTHSMSTTKICFLKLRTLVVQRCNKLENVFPISICKELPELDALIIREAHELEEIFVCEEGDQKVNLPNLKVVAFTNLPSLYQTQGIHFQAVQNRFVQNCQELSLTNAITEHFINDTIDYMSEWQIDDDIMELANHLHGEIDTSIKPSHGNDNLEGSTPEKPVAESLSTTSATENEPPIQVIDHKQKGVEITVEEVTALTNSKTLKSSTRSKSLGSSSQDQSIQEGSTSGTKNDQDIQLVDLKQKSVRLSIEDIDNAASQETTQTNNNQDFDLYLHMESLYRQFQEVSKGHSNGNENQSAQITKEFAAWIEAEAASWHKLTSSQLEVSASERLAGATLSTISEIIDEQLVAPKQKGSEISFEEGTTSTCDKTITSSTHLEVCDGKISIPSSSVVNMPATKDVDIGDSQETIAMEDINKLIEEDPLFALEKLLTGVQSYSIRSLLQELKILMDSSSDLDHLLSNQESKLKLVSLFHGLNQHQRLLPSNVKEFVEKVQNFFNDNIMRLTTSQQLLRKHNQLLDLKTELMNKLKSAKSTQTHINNESSTANAQIHELSLQIDDLKSVVNKCYVQKQKLKAECTEWAQQSKELLSALASTEINVIEAERMRNLATEGFANLKSSFPTI
ncbi:uncharacterized protein [Medicago truncatula]|uniref:uncharacterized protein isoform X3 n=1 Tax=Medicago truncatula TaxID=3880 RepID=UPI0019676E9E|nr:uncharacterized protein LOC25479932 isoform X3 [Medicago truncatula]